MKRNNNRRHAFTVLLLLAVFLPGLALAQGGYSRVVVFGDSLSDPGNAFVLTGTALTPPYTSLVPDYPYARGGHHLTNGSTWIEQLAVKMRLGGSVGPALRVPGKFSNYAIDRTRACSDSPSPSHIDLTTQVGSFLDRFGTAPANALYVLYVGSNDVKDALANPAIGEQVLGCALLSISDNIGALINAGARTFLVANVPNLGLIPFVSGLDPPAPAIATQVSFFFNQQLEDIVSAYETGYGGLVSFYRLDTFKLLTQAGVDHPQLNVTDSCIDISTGKACTKAQTYLFWDGIHPTVKGHQYIAEAAAKVLGLK